MKDTLLPDTAFQFIFAQCIHLLGYAFNETSLYFCRWCCHSWSHWFIQIRFLAIQSEHCWNCARKTDCKLDSEIRNVKRKAVTQLQLSVVDGLLGSESSPCSRFENSVSYPFVMVENSLVSDHCLFWACKEFCQTTSSKGSYVTSCWTHCPECLTRWSDVLLMHWYLGLTSWHCKPNAMTLNDLYKMNSPKNQRMCFFTQFLRLAKKWPQNKIKLAIELMEGCVQDIVTSARQAWSRIFEPSLVIFQSLMSRLSTGPSMCFYVVGASHHRAKTMPEWCQQRTPSKSGTKHSWESFKLFHRLE